MTAPVILSAIRLGQTALDAKHAALGLLWKKFGTSIRQARRARKISLKRFAACMGYTAAMVAMLESGTRRWPMKKAELAVKLMTRREQWPD